MPTLATRDQRAEESAESLCALDQLARGQRATVVGIGGDEDLRRRLLEMGLVPGTSVELLRRAPFGDPAVYLLRGYQLSLRRAQAQLITVDLPAEDAESSGDDAVPVQAEPRPETPLRRVVLAGNPNCGKTTLFNALTGLCQKVANYPGVTVEKRSGRCRLADGGEVDVGDLPGSYSLSPRSPDERVAVEVLRGEWRRAAPDDRAVARFSGQ